MRLFLLFFAAALLLPGAFGLGFFNLFGGPEILFLPGDVNGTDLNVGFVNALDVNARDGNFVSLTVGTVFAQKQVTFLDANVLRDFNVMGNFSVGGKFFSSDLNSSFVPYVGATKDVNLGSKAITTIGTLGAGAMTGTSFTDGTILIGSGSIADGIDAYFEGTITAQTLDMYRPAAYFYIGSPNWENPASITICGGGWDTFNIGGCDIHMSGGAITGMGEFSASSIYTGSLSVSGGIDNAPYIVVGTIYDSTWGTSLVAGPATWTLTGNFSATGTGTISGTIKSGSDVNISSDINAVGFATIGNGLNMFKGLVAGDINASGKAIIKQDLNVGRGISLNGFAGIDKNISITGKTGAICDMNFSRGILFATTCT